MPRLRVATANSASGRDHRSGAPDLDSWAAAAADLDVDVLAVQEVDHLLGRSGRVDQTAAIATACATGGPAWEARFAAAVLGTPGDTRTFAPAAHTSPDGPSYGIALLSRHPVRSWWALRMAPSRLRLPVVLPAAAGRRLLWVPDEQRVALAARVAVPGGEVTVVCTHLSFAPARAVGQLRELRSWAAALPRPLLLLGDLNLPPPLPTVVTGWPGLVRERTFPAPAPRLQLDHVLLDDPDAHLVVAGTGAPVLANSDHRALVVTFTHSDEGGPLHG